MECPQTFPHSVVVKRGKTKVCSWQEVLVIREKARDASISWLPLARSACPRLPISVPRLVEHGTLWGLRKLPVVGRGHLTKDASK